MSCLEYLRGCCCCEIPHSLIPVGRLIEAGFSVNHRIPSQANVDGFSLKAIPLYGGTITTPDGKTIIVMEYAQHTWRLPLPSNKRFSKPKLLPRATSENFVDLRSTGSSFINPSNAFHMLDEINNVDGQGYIPAYLTQDRIEGRFQQRYELMLKQREIFWNLPHFSRTLQQSPDCIEFTGQGY